MNTDFLIIYRSSAGSGKTYTLTREYLRLALSGRKQKVYRKILAVTFTNKAMQEMKDRIVGQLYAFSQGKLAGMGEELRRDFDMQEEEFRQECTTLLRDILHDYSHFSITTIDAFFQRVIRSFARELGLAGSYRLELDTDLTIHEIIQDLMAQVEDDKVLRDWLVEFARHRLMEGGSWMVEKHLEKFTRQLLLEDFQVHEEQVRMTPREELHRLGQDLKGELARIRVILHGKAQEVLDFMEQRGVSANDLHHKKGGVASFPEKVLKDDLEVGVRIRTTIEEDMFTGTSAPKGQVKAALDAGLRTKFTELLELVDSLRQDFTTASLVLQNMYVFGLTIDILRKMNEYKLEHDLMFISDATRLLSDLVARTDALFVYEKVGTFYEHFLIDEFQDTSSMQWESFRPLVTESLSAGKANLIVGDVKQSIYRWRGGQLDLLQHGVLKEYGEELISLRNLGTNFRSARAVVEFNNALFRAIPEVVGKAYGNKEEIYVRKAIEYLGSIYEDVSQALRPGSDGSDPGFVYAEFVVDDKEREDSIKQQCLSRIPAIVEELQDKGVPLREMAILVRNNKEGKMAADLLGEWGKNHPDNGYEYHVISNDSLFLSGSPACRLLIAALRYLREPENAINRAELAYLYYQIHDENSAWEELFPACGIQENRDLTKPEELVRQLSSWNKRPLLELVEKLIHRLGLDQQRGQFAYLQTFMDHVLKFVSRERGDVGGLLDWWEERAGKESIKVPEDLNAIRIMTIHKSKGLEFHSVIMPFLQWKIDHKEGPLLWIEGRKEPVKRVVPVQYSGSLATSHFEGEYHDERLKAFVDNVNLLYVALTRASHDLWIVAPEGKNEIKDINQAVREILSRPGHAGDGVFSEESQTFTCGIRDFVYATQDQEEENKPLRLKKYTESDWEDNLVLKPVNQSLIVSDRNIKINTGILIHQLLSRVRYTADFRKALLEVTWTEALSEEDVERIRDQILQAFNRPVVKDWFSRKWRVMNEAAILTPDGEYRPDRVMLNAQEVVIVDYKTGMQRDKDIRQMQTYKELLRQMEGKPVRAYLWYIDLDDIVEV